MNNLTDKQLIDLILKAGDSHALSSQTKNEIKSNLLSVITSTDIRTYSHHISHILNPRRFAMPIIPIIIAAVLALGSGTAALANTATPGDSLYPVDQWMERIQERLTSNTDGKARLMARFSEERLAELAKIRQTDPAQQEATLKARWEERHQEAINRVSESIAKVNEIQARFEEKIKATTDEAQKAVFQKVINHLEEVEARRTERLETVESKPYSGAGAPIRQRIQQWTQENQQEMEQIRNEIRNEFGEGALGAGQGSGVQTQTQTGTQTQTQNRNGQTNTVSE